MAEVRGVKVRVWKEGQNVLIRSDALHITTYGKSTEEALENFKEALSLNLEFKSEEISKKTTLPFEFELESSYGRKAAKGKAPLPC